ncbi:hypothetical protein CWI84_08415 [Idiomarina tyrosinivorans]|uniref:HipA-like C-terminal domain-containing protein n=1 Tax=Idiomarina tyrosinivorans TaxID=1445662 RepID=A0A432ZPZ2_9GAMM|nr:type II toxin-antitoxin system HipA family toxin YjjJ [Idiomarina tyrosinivorans]RUO79974.1 hypothetical protein CWI84_08415 [Idiomarina tyrosinivorans]
MSKLTDNIILTLKLEPKSAASLARQLGVDGTTISRQLAKLSSQVLKAGEGRSTRWFLRRTLPQFNGATSLPIYRVNRNGEAEKMAELYSVYPANCYLVQYFRFESDANKSVSEWKFYESLPWWLSDMRPQGFLGRLFAKRLAEQSERVDTDPRAWSDDDVLAMLAKYPQDHIGNLLIGADAYQRWLNAPVKKSINDNDASLMAEQIASGEHFDSSARGEQPKFTGKLGDAECIVKFSGRISGDQTDSVARRWADLLHAEAISSHVMNRSDFLKAAHNRSFCANHRVLLASRRFDRLNNGGRVGVVSFLSLEAEFVGKGLQSWPEVADELQAQRVITAEATNQCKIAWAFGQLIANSDMHLGNVSVENCGGRPLSLAPIYDMLPMHFSPKPNGDLPSSVFPIRTTARVSKVCWQAAYQMALDFWHNVLESADVSEHFKILARQQLAAVDEFSSVINRMA